VATTIVFDGVDNQLLGIALPSLMAEWQLPRAAFAPVISLGYVGMMIGGAVAGILGDRIGRRAALLGSVALFGVTTSAIGFIDSATSLAIFRFLAGLGLGGAMPNAAALAAEYSPARIRAFAVTLAIVCVPIGGTIAGLVGLRALPVVGWRTVFLVGGVIPLVVAVVLRWLLPESPQFLAGETQRRSERVAPVRSLFSGDLRRDTIALWTAFLSCMLSVYLPFAWLTALLTGAGFTADTASAGITVFNFGGVAGAIAGGIAIGRFGSKWSILSLAALAIVGALVLAFMPMSPSGSTAPLIAMLAVIGAAINGVQTTMYALAAHVYPTAIRATGVGSAVAFGRTGAVLSGYVGTWVIDAGGARSYFGAIAAMMTLAFVALASVRRHVR
jgi:AAHS family 4-hydroxybenzoate transporter-like MFS transporter